MPASTTVAEDEASTYVSPVACSVRDDEETTAVLASHSCTLSGIVAPAVTDLVGSYRRQTLYTGGAVGAVHSAGCGALPVACSRW